MINGIKLKRFKSHEDTDLEFSEGTNLIIGQMGSGKTCIVEGLCFALFGTFPSIKSHKLGLEDVVMARPTKYSEMSVEVKFSVKEKAYWVERSYRKGESTAYLRSSNAVIESGPQRVTETVCNLLNIDYELFIRAVYSEQNRLDWFFYLNKGERKKYFDDLLGISKFESARTSATATINQLKQESNSLNSYIIGANWTEDSKKLVEFEKKLIELEVWLKNSKIDFKTNLEKLKICSEKTNELENKEKLHIQKSSSLESQKAMTNQLSKMIGELKEYDIDDKDSDKINSEEKTLVKEIKTINENLQIISLSEKTIEIKLNELNKISKKLNELSLVEGQSESKILALCEETERKLQETLEANKTQTEQLLSTKQIAGKADAYLEQIKLIKKEQIEIDSEIEKIVKQMIWPLEELNAQIEKKDQMLSIVLGELSKNKQAVLTLEKVDSKCPVCQKPLDKENVEELLKSGKIKISELEKQANQLENEIKSEKLKIKTNIEMHSKLIALEDNSKHEKEKLEKIQFEYNSISNKINLINEIEKKIEQLQTSAKGLTKQKNSLTETLNQVKQFTTLKNEESITVLEKEQNEKQLLKLKEKYSKQQLLDSEKRLDNIQHIKQILDYKQRKIEIEREITNLEKQIKEINFSKTELDKQRSELNELNKDKSELEASIRIKNNERELMEKQTEELRKKSEQISSTVEKIKKIESTAESMQKILNSLIDTQVTLRSQLVSSLNETSNDLWKSIYPYGDYPAMRLVANENDYILELQANDGNWMVIEGASGGERVCAALCLRVSLALILSPALSLIILDEPTHNMDSAAVAMLSRALHDELPKFVSQAFLITHDESLKESASSRIFLIERDKDSSDKSMINLLTAQ